MYNIDEQTDEPDITSTNNRDYTDLTYVPGGGYTTIAGRFVNSMYATRSGLIVLTSYKEDDTPVLSPLSQPDPET